MSATFVSEIDSPLVFAWDTARGRRWAIAGFLLVSLLLHALCFYLFQIIYPPAVALLPPPGRVTLIAPNSDEGRVLFRWLEAEDPALASTTQQPGEGKSLALPVVKHVASYFGRYPALKEIPPYNPDLRVPSAQPPAPVERPRSPMQTVPTIARTVLLFSPEFDSLGALQIPEMKFSASGREPPQAAQFRLAADENGEVRYCFLENSSGDSALDKQARKYLAGCRLSAIRDPKSGIRGGLVWGTASVEWGNDIAAASSTGNVAP